MSRSEQQKYSQRRVHSQDHLFVLRLVGLPAPAGRPPSHHQRISAQNEDQANEYQGYAQVAQPRGITHKSPPPIFPSGIAAQDGMLDAAPRRVNSSSSTTAILT